MGTLLRWWIGDPYAERSARAYLPVFPGWAWLGRLPEGHQGVDVGWEWYDRYVEVRLYLEELDRPRAEAVSIPVPEEQQRFTAALRDLVESTGLYEERWLIFGDNTRQVEGYLEGRYIPQDTALRGIAKKCARHTDKDGADTAKNLQYLLYLAREARAGRARARRLARRQVREQGEPPR
ncbi:MULTISPECIES: hypothetical protein [Streptomyces]|uniref:hypothetical protein n=1 Tax=Streptomyces TaxID=1883 RepID=UPI00163D02FD|nr:MULTISPECIES: hypothetical protein [Streptomyces]MBC2873760.1 hypothetical protein [Streptomyces sp. TYQ1024]UBI37815.1 hypothetical protein K7I03_15960 [Streptomyces mobaraensis]UKW30402.1 hypothetical protein MCU78_15925 [Streptomyces sp. TYQ1024]